MEEQSSQWAIVEIFGHKTLAGKVTKDTSLFPLLRIDVPQTSNYPAYTIEHGPQAIFSILYVSEEVACKIAESINLNPITVYAPELITRQHFEKMIYKYKQHIVQLRKLPLPAQTDGFDVEANEND